MSPFNFASYHTGEGGSGGGSSDTSYGGSSGGGYGGGSSAAGGLLLLGGIYYFFIRDNGDDEADAFSSKLTDESRFEINFHGSETNHENSNFSAQNFSFPQNTFQLNIKYKLN